MKIAVQTSGTEDRFGIDGAYRMIAESGFDGVDANIDHFVSGTEIREKRVQDILINGTEKDIRELARPRGVAAKNMDWIIIRRMRRYPAILLAMMLTTM